MLMVSLILLQVLPLFVEYSIVTFDIFVDVQVMLCELPAIHDSPPFGDVTVTVGTRIIENIASLTSLVPALEASLIRINACAVGVFGIVQA